MLCLREPGSFHLVAVPSHEVVVMVTGNVEGRPGGSPGHLLDKAPQPDCIGQKSVTCVPASLGRGTGFRECVAVLQLHYLILGPTTFSKSLALTLSRAVL
jgi:hypothetical protein